MTGRPPPSDPPEVEAALWEGFCGDLAWDVGANAGQSLWHLTEAFTEVHAFEPAEESFRELARQWGAQPGVVLRQVAVSDHEGTLETSVRAGSIAKGELTVVANMPEQDRGLPAWAALPWGPETGRRAVPCVTLDSLAAAGGRAPDLVKVDTEGHEAQVLAGARDILAAGKTAWLVECHGARYRAACEHALTGAGYAPEVIRHPHYAPRGRMWEGHCWLKAKARER